MIMNSLRLTALTSFLWLCCVAPTHAADRIGVLDQAGTLFAKGGPLNAAWAREYAGVLSFALDGD
jgi:hypothetical protein